MQAVLPYILLITGFVLLVKGADYFVDGSSSVAALLKVSPLVIGLTIVAMGTSAPEAAVSITSAVKGINGLSVGNIIGSNIFNILVVIGVSAALVPFKTSKTILKRDLPVNIFISLLLLVFMWDKKLNRSEGIILLILMTVYIVALIINSLKNQDAEENIEVLSPVRSIIYILVGLAAIIGGGQLVVNSTVKIAQSFGISTNSSFNFGRNNQNNQQMNKVPLLGKLELKNIHFRYHPKPSQKHHQFRF